MWLEVSGLPADEIETAVRAADGAGYSTLWFGEVGNWDPLTLLTVAAREAASPRLGSAVVRSYPRHPLALAAQALTIQAMTGNRLVLGLGPSHAPIVEGQYGIPFTAPARNLREYLSVLIPLLRGEPVSYHGTDWTAVGQLELAGAEPPPVVVAAMGPKLLQLTGELADGVITTWVTPDTVIEQVVPALRRAAEGAGRAVPEIIAQMPVAVTDDPDGTRELLNARLGMTRDLPSYRAAFEREGVSGPGDLVIAGDELVVAKAIRRYAEAGVSEFMAVPVGAAADQARTARLLPELTGDARAVR
ncbi:TIGR03564 family F420-dependent LLM class oxidoreductase [Phytoactinopolyspora sp. XMNu-373]|uniref:TIGR03564 family F420-dependent LLM class oxidoreductase n=2 Tax=Phytoactinopolyspora mesophila TaxID=2650750 RepID=A0A7K3M2C3_9ACTN|nr:TIGR03564 family F420-dependent LLM class oxidoreductase [Phytoactinopolyspora mesophila]